ncbi:uncharacterized protein N7518_009429 [Penicillium psychrosexuale]|uniref:uncharacterized protein n=1 Tax=Penicillium psychrosexuale TaxID=1002107 RepID=UPI0025456990|nr:uncharacterized protein N7518_009429 [Penicillium psychrosexuale]KAJ5783752.1 hypothetical protein N7518_009429 [Penicillium psychrosexuale]
MARTRKARKARQQQLLTPAPSGKGTPSPSTQKAPDRSHTGTPGASDSEGGRGGSHVSFRDGPNKKPRGSEYSLLDDEVMQSGGPQDLDSRQLQPTIEYDDEQPTIEHDNEQSLLDHNLYLPFFNELNQKIKAANKKDRRPALGGCVDYEIVTNAVTLWRLRYGNINVNRTKRFVTDFNYTYNMINAFNEKFYLSENWNISPMELEGVLSSNDMRTMYANVASNTYKRAPPTTRQPSGFHNLTEGNLTGFQQLEARAQSEQRALSSGEVLYWWKKGTGYQTFVKYGDVDSTRAHVSDILGVGWKVPDDDDDNIDLLNLIVPGPGVTYPQTRVIVLWSDRRTTLKTRTFIRRIATGPSRNGDNIIYQKALEVEQTRGNDQPSEDEGDEEDYAASQGFEYPEDNPPRRRTKRRPQPQEMRESTTSSSRAPKYSRGHYANVKRGESGSSRYRESSYQTHDLRRDIEKPIRQPTQMENRSSTPRQAARH